MLTELGITVKAEPHLIQSSAFYDSNSYICADLEQLESETSMLLL